jgi:hypothetical protein
VEDAEGAGRAIHTISAARSFERDPTAGAVVTTDRD